MSEPTFWEKTRVLLDVIEQCRAACREVGLSPRFEAGYTETGNVWVKAHG